MNHLVKETTHMFKKKCRCGAAEKNFRMDIGPFYLDECCKTAGFDDLGNKPGATLVAEAKATVQIPVKTTAAAETVEKAVAAAALAPAPAKKTGKLRDMRVTDLLALAKEMSLLVTNEMTKKEIIVLIQAAREAASPAT